MNRVFPFLVAAAVLMPGAVLAQGGPASAQVKRGEYLVTTGLCHAAIRPWWPGPTAQRLT